jgi:NAD(P)-dependent dehydrogenase (short-subunit alcohol dehydrogenase family)
LASSGYGRDRNDEYRTGERSTRGIREAIAPALSTEGHLVAATYHGNEQATARFDDATGIAVFRWDVADGSDCREGVARVKSEVGPVSVLDNAGVARDRLSIAAVWPAHQPWQDLGPDGGIAGGSCAARLY